jgi:hypothetical protein
MSSAPAAEQTLRPGSAGRSEGIGPAVRIEPTRLLLVFSGLPTSGLCSLDLPRGGGHRGYAAVVDGSGVLVTCSSHSIGGR